MTDERINPGDTVGVLDIDGSRLYTGVVLGLPCATGDCWKIETPGEIVYVQMFGSIVKKKVIP